MRIAKTSKYEYRNIERKIKLREEANDAIYK